MVKLYTWLPTTPEEAVEREMVPDLGHCSLEILDDNGRATMYASYWPEQTSFPGRLMDFLKHRQARQPDSYARETDPNGHFMQRPADYVDIVDGLDEARISILWSRLRYTHYHFHDWNCSNVIKQLLLSGMSKQDRSLADDASGCVVTEAPRPSTLLSRLRALLDWHVVACSPQDVHRMAVAYNQARRRSQLDQSAVDLSAV